MEQFEEKLLKRLVEMYRRSKKDSGTNRIVRRTQVKPSELYKKYDDNDGDLKRIQALNEAVQSCCDRGFVTFEMKGFGYEIAAVYLNDSMVGEVEKYLGENWGYESKQEKMQYVMDLIDQYQGQSPLAEQECARLKRELEKNQVPKSYDQEEDLLKALVFVEKNREMLYIREASMLIYGSSKYFEENTLDPVCKMLRAYLGKTCRDEEMPDEILKEYQIQKETQRLCLKGDCRIRINGRTLEVGALKQGIEFHGEEISQIETIRMNAEEWITVENRTAYLRCPPDHAVVFYLGGYANRFQRDFLKMAYRDNAEKTFSHFGDLDAGGFFIHEHLCQLTGIPFSMKYMSKSELQDERYQSCLRTLTENDRRRLRSLREKDAYRETVEYMLEKNVKLEQEIISYYLANEWAGER